MKEQIETIKDGIINKKAEIIRWAVPALIFLVLVIATMAVSLGFSRKSVGELAEKQFENAATYYADSFYNTISCLKEAALPMMQYAEINYAGDVDNFEAVQPYLEALKASTSVTEAWVIAKDGKGLDSNGKQVSASEQSFLDAVVDDTKKVVFTIFGPDERGMVAYIYPFEERDFTFVTFYEPEQFLIDTSVHKLDVRTWYAAIDGSGNVITLKAGNSKMTKDSNVLEDLKSADIADYAYTDILTKMGREETFVFFAKTEAGERYLAMSPAKINDWYFVLCIPKANYKMLCKRALGPIRYLSVILPLMMIAFFVIVLRLIAKNDKLVGDQNQELRVKADTDLLTGLNNKVATEYKIKEYISATERKQGMLFVIDIDNFKKINDTMGHAFGDEVLRSIGESLRVAFRSTDVIGRFGGDEFIIFLKNISTDELIQKEADKVLGIFQNYVVGTYTKYTITASIGCAVFPRDSEDFEGLFKAADAGLYLAKRGGKNQLAFYNAGETEEAK